MGRKRIHELNTTKTRVYRSWCHVRRRRHVTDPSWAYFQVFSAWYEEELIANGIDPRSGDDEGERPFMELNSFLLTNKPLMKRQELVYSPESCCLVHKEISKVIVELLGYRKRGLINLSKQDRNVLVEDAITRYPTSEKVRDKLRGFVEDPPLSYPVGVCKQRKKKGEAEELRKKVDIRRSIEDRKLEQEYDFDYE